MADKIRIGLVGASVAGTWSTRTHLPVLQSNPDVELTAVCTTKAASAEAARAAYGARLAFDDYNKMVRSPEVDAIAVVVRVPSHYAPTKAALLAGKHVYCEWPLGRTTEEAVKLAALAHRQGLVSAIGLQARAHPAFLHMKKLVSEGFVGEVMTVKVGLTRDGVLARPMNRTWQRDIELGANTLTIPNGHTLDVMRFVVGDFARLSAVVTTQAKQWRATDTNDVLDVTSPDNVLISGQLDSGAVASLHVATVPFASSGYCMEIYGREGTLVATGIDTPQLCNISLSGARGGNTLSPIDLPDQTAAGRKGLSEEATFVDRMYTQFARAIRGEANHLPTFSTAVELHRIIDKIRQSADDHREVQTS